jgi:hypothetical protein
VDQQCVRSCTSLGEPLDGHAVDAKGPLLLPLAQVDIVERGAVEDHQRLESLESGRNRSVIRDVEFLPGGSEHLRMFTEERSQIRSELAPAPRNEHSPECHSTEPKRSRRG